MGERGSLYSQLYTEGFRIQPWTFSRFVWIWGVPLVCWILGTIMYLIRWSIADFDEKGIIIFLFIVGLVLRAWIHWDRVEGFRCNNKDCPGLILWKRIPKHDAGPKWIGVCSQCNKQYTG